MTDFNENKFIYKGHEYKTGDKVTCIIEGLFVEDARIYISDFVSNSEVSAYISQNNHFGSGTAMFGYKGSWSFYIKNCICSRDIRNLNPYKSPDILVEAIDNVIGKEVTFLNN